MEPITRETFEQWAKDNNWLVTNETATTMGRQISYVTPSGSVAVALFDLKGNLAAIGQPMPPQAGFGIGKG